jgi:twitching motility protein PilJ
VVGGALLAENAGAALDEIEQVSNQIASLVQNIYGSARSQSKVATDINRRTVALKDISGQTGKAASATTTSISKLAKLAGELRKSVSGFRLPESASVTRITSVKDAGVDGDEQRAAG